MICDVLRIYLWLELLKQVVVFGVRTFNDHCFKYLFPNDKHSCKLYEKPSYNSAIDLVILFV
jgi:hypothetical protein